MNDFDDNAADAAFRTDPSFDPDATPVQLGTPAEDTYIVEVSEAEQTAQGDEKPDELYAPTTGVQTEDPAPDDSLANIDRENLDLLIGEDNQADAFAGVNEDTVLSQLFDEDFDPNAVAQPEPTGALVDEQLEPTAEMPRNELEPTTEMPAASPDPTEYVEAQNLEPTAEMPGGNLEPTTEMPAADLDPTAELPADFVDPAQVIDPTAEPTATEHEEQMSMTQSFSENLERLDQTNADSNQQDKLAPTDSTTSTLQIPSNDAEGLSTAEINLQELIKGAAEDESLSQTLHEALSLLERDYEDEFTASQILERREIEKALQDEEDDDTVAARKVK